MEIDDIISYHALVTEEKEALQKGMNFGVGDGLANRVSSKTLAS